ncbi:MAG: UDP-N-acetylmuramoyl-tripeptide--D-alanyl-D-alanine ligase [Spirochaetaceae bacterium]|jgi:UDP-N-acetylmuramoyl-tripeptide--D-alanyl-D-alanine ligase|nr:UDP-N-acetylmuramoyl-tripeptide--D-alanyl-D-alanine ligase [Spirochaetaceae bacterium]
MACTDLAEAVGGFCLSFREQPGSFSSVSVDSRTVEPGGLFVALPGSVQDGHKFVRKAFENGASAALVARSRWENPDFGLEKTAKTHNAAVIVTDNTLRALQSAGAYHLKRFPGLLKIGVTGSSGKTTVKTLAGAMLNREQNAFISPGNLNSETGAPLSAFMVGPQHTAGIFELGTNRQGEIEEIAKMLKPHIALITNIGSAHIGFFGSKQKIAEEKKAIFSQFTGAETALIPEDEPFRDFLAEGVRGNAVFYGPSMPELGPITDRGIEGWEIVWDNAPALFPLPGRHNLRNALSAAAIAKAAGASPQAIREGLADAPSLFGRTEILRGPLTLIRDCYNANPESTAAAIAMCDALPVSGRRIYVIGSMLELGGADAHAHAVLGRTLAESKADLVCLFGEEFSFFASAFFASASGFSAKNKFFSASASGFSAKNKFFSASASGFPVKNEFFSASASASLEEGKTCLEKKLEKKLEKNSEEKKSFLKEEKKIGGKEWFYTNSIETLAEYLADRVRFGDTVLLKGSRGRALERLTGVLLPGAC